MDPCSSEMRRFAWRADLLAKKSDTLFQTGPVAQLDRASDFGSEGWGFDSLRGRHSFQNSPLGRNSKPAPAWEPLIPGNSGRSALELDDLCIAGSQQEYIRCVSSLQCVGLKRMALLGPIKKPFAPDSANKTKAGLKSFDRCPQFFSQFRHLFMEPPHACYAVFQSPEGWC